MTNISLQSETKAQLKARFDIDGFISFGRILNDNELHVLSTRVDSICDGEVAMPEASLKCVPTGRPKATLCGAMPSGKFSMRTSTMT